MTDPTVAETALKRARELVIGDRLPENQLIYKFNKGPVKVVFLADEPEDSHTFIAYQYPNGRHESMTVLSDSALDVFPAADPTGQSVGEVEKPECGAWCANGPGGLCAKDLGHEGDHGDRDCWHGTECPGSGPDCGRS